MGLLGLVLISFTPGLFWLWFFLRHDIHRPAPRRLVAITFFLGCVSTIPAGIVNVTLGPDDLNDPNLSLATVAVSMLLVTGPFEELFKFLAVRWVPYRSLYFDEPIDGLVFAAAAALGFASLENFIYVLTYGPEVMLVRAPISTLAHLSLSSVWGYALGQHHASGGRRRGLLIGSLVLAAIAHGLFNVAAFAIKDVATGLMVSALLVGFGGFWAHRAFRWGQRNSPFRFKKNYPLIECPSCQSNIRAFHRFCNYCGQAVPDDFEALICGHCKNRNRPDASFCTGCGDQLLTR
ncbi:MAG: PrsW family glutamic-type intramembrane protease [Dehalococcoidia bacterium]